jgi:DNA-binding CsgD family transcriptional regulator
MEQLTFQDTQKLLHAIEELYAFDDSSSFEVKALTIVDRLVKSELPVFHFNKLRSHQISYTTLPNDLGLTPELEAVPRRHWEEHPITQHMPQTFYGAYKISDFISQKELHRLEGLYQQFMRVREWEDMMSIFLPPASPQNWDELFQDDAVMGGMTLNRRSCNFTERDRLLLNLLRPHLFQAYENDRRLARLQQNLTRLHQDLDCLGLIILNVAGQIELITSPAIEYLQTYFPNSVNLRYLPDLLWAWVKYQISAKTQSRLPLRIESDGKQLAITLVLAPDKDRYLLLLEEQTLSLLPLLSLLGLSQRETEVLFWVIRGEDNQAIADRLSVHIATVRKHLESIFRKLGVQSRTEAIAQALEKLGILNSPDLT